MNDKAQTIVVERLQSNALSLRALATLRMAVFRGWPYLYEGDEGYEERYLGEFLGSDQATLVLARVGAIPVGMATASPLSGQSEALVDPLAAAGIVIADSFYFGESVLLPQFQGLGLGHRFFDKREAAAREAGARQALFCAIVRDAEDPRRPDNARELQSFWRSRGYAPLDGVQCFMEWRECGAGKETAHTMQFWHKSLDIHGC